MARTTIDAGAAAPEWFTRALGVAPRHTGTEVAGARIHYRSWGSPGRRNIVLVHGGAAHSGWWDHLAPLLATDGMVVAPDLAGHGDSDHRDRYGIPLWADDVRAVARHAGIGDGFSLIGHSLGGLVTAHLAADPLSGVREAVIVDSPVGALGRPTPVESRDLTPARRRTYDSRAETVARFRPVPAQPMLPYIAEHIAEDSVRETAGTWSWKFDSTVLIGLVAEAEISGARCPVAFFRAENGLPGLHASGVRTDIEKAGAVFVELPEAGHAPMLDQPLALLTGIRTAFAGWDRAARADG